MDKDIADLMANLVSGVQKKPCRTVVYGVAGIGKSTFANQFPKCFFLDIEDRLSHIDVYAKTPRALKTSEEVMGVLRFLATNDTEYQTVCIDSLDWLEAIIFDELEEKFTPKELSYGKKYEKAAARMKEILEALNYLRNKKGMEIICTAHAEIKKISLPDQDEYDRYQPRLTAKVYNVVSEWATEIFFANYEVMIKKSGEGFSEKNKAITSGRRLLKCADKPSQIGKCSIDGMPEAIEMNYEAYMKHRSKK